MPIFSWSSILPPESHTEGGGSVDCSHLDLTRFPLTAHSAYCIVDISARSSRTQMQLRSDRNCSGLAIVKSMSAEIENRP